MTAEGRIRKAKKEDVEYISQWLQQQAKESAKGSFLCNWHLTLQSFCEGELIVFVESKTKKAVAYQWGSLTSPGILEVKEDMQGKGIGKRLVNHRIKQAYQKGVCALKIQCKPSSSISFWEKFGFTIYDKINNYAYKLLQKEIAVQHQGTEVSITTSIYPDSRKWNNNVEPVFVFHQKGVLINKSTVYLTKKVCIPEIHELYNGDAVIGIEIENKLIHLDKARYEESRSLGLRPTLNGYTIEVLQIKENIA